MRQRIVVGVDGSPGSLAALHRAAAEARERHADLHVVLAWQLPGGGLGGRTTYGPAVLRECREAAVDDLRAILDSAFAVERPSVPLSGLTVRGEPGAVLVEAAGSAGDLLV
ncbi:universal stress protein, partial [Streptomyces sp. st170]